MTEIKKREIEDALDELLSSHARSLQKEYAAAAHQTRHDYARAREAREEFEEARERFLTRCMAFL